ncbi:MAG: glycine betaine ABC transporter substrate-binding protein, partial [Candidatus Binatia bacterium]
RGVSPVRIGAKPFTEQYVLAEVIGGRIARATGEPVTVLPSLGSTVVFDALVAGDVDAYVDYSGTIWTTILRESGLPDDRRAMLETIRTRLEREHGVLVVGALGFENAYCLALAREKARRLAVARVSDLAAHSPSLAIGGDYEFFARPEWRSLETSYGLRFREQRTMDPSLLYEAAASGEVDVVSAYSSDGRIAAYDLVVLEDDRRAIPPYDAVILASARFARERPAALAALRALEGRIDPETMRRLNRAVDADGRAPAEVALELLDQLFTSSSSES